MAHVNGLIPTSALTALSVGGHLLATPARAFEEWRRQAAAAGRTLTITSVADAYRPLAVQERVFLQRYIPQATGGGIYGDVRHYKGVRYVRRHGAAAAVPGTSNHGRGLAIDVANAGPFGGAFHDWMLKTGPELGWSNVEGRSVNEPWHWVHDSVTIAASGSTAGAAAPLKPTAPMSVEAITISSHQEDPMLVLADTETGLVAVLFPSGAWALIQDGASAKSLRAAAGISTAAVDTVTWHRMCPAKNRLHTL